jgi:single-strand DNA-binding protein
MSINNVNLVGRVGKEPEVKYFDSGSIVCRLTLAVNRRRRGDDEPDWFDLELWGPPAQNSADHVRKGALIAVCGELTFQSWKDRATGVERSKPVIKVSRIDFLTRAVRGDSPEEF